MRSKASFCGTDATRSPGNRSRLNPAGGLRPAWTEPPPFAFCSTHAKRSQTENRTSHLLFKADILTCYEHGRRHGPRARSRFHARGQHSVARPHEQVPRYGRRHRITPSILFRTKILPSDATLNRMSVRFAGVLPCCKFFS